MILVVILQLKYVIKAAIVGWIETLSMRMADESWT
jgi:hypothetical protein